MCRRLERLRCRLVRLVGQHVETTGVVEGLLQLAQGLQLVDVGHGVVGLAHKLTLACSPGGVERLLVQVWVE